MEVTEIKFDDETTDIAPDIAPDLIDKKPYGDLLELEDTIYRPKIVAPIIEGEVKVGGSTTIDQDGHFIDNVLNTSSQEILKDFTFTADDYAGAFKTGDIAWDATTGRVTGGTGFLINGKGILAALNGDETVTILNDGSATFKGEVKATSGWFGDGTDGVGVDSDGLLLSGTGKMRTATAGSDRVRMANGFIEALNSSDILRFRIYGTGTSWFDKNGDQGGVIDTGPAASIKELWIYGNNGLSLRTGIGKKFYFRTENDTDTQDLLVEDNNVLVGDLTEGGKSYLHIKGDDDSDNDPGCLVLYNHAGTPYYLWVDNTGDLRIHTMAPSDEDADGSVVGTQS